MQSGSIKSLDECRTCEDCYSSRKRTILHVNDSGELKECVWDTGIMGEAIKNNSIISIFNCYTHPQFNPNIDISC